ncbi:ABC transporter substrate-binding protein [Sutterella sp.]|uniref:ABC transporter substrate-binding protein n=1 Tax=Sutterella sp. TaxID=1981025 RepID=UPI0026E100C0|nr:ABC transporter substrate-binding protein [Sutterella sp.]MDO5530788.1 ABC transporter substrate-binding protein [Sutterella sp.]
MEHNSEKALTLSRRRLLAAAGAAGITAAAGALPGIAQAAAPAGKAKIAVLPAVDALILYAAESDGLFKAEGIDCEIVPFKSALELNAAMRAGRIAGHYSNILTTIAQRANGIDSAIAVTTWHTSPDYRAFGFAVSPAKAAELTSLDVVRARRGVQTSTSSGTITDWVLHRMVETAPVPPECLKSVEVAQIPIRLQMLNAGRLDTALFYEPLLTLIESKGGRTIWDDRGLNEPLSMVALRGPYLTDDFVGAFRRALAAAAKRIDADQQKYLPLAVKKGLIPQAIVKDYRLQKFSGFATRDGLPPLPTDEHVRAAGEWLVANGLVKKLPDLGPVVYRSAANAD